MATVDKKRASRKNNKKKTKQSRQDRTEETVNLLKAAAWELIGEGGVAAVTFATVAKRTGFSTSIVAYHFGTKNNFIQFLLNDVLESNSAMYTETLKGENVADEIGELFARIATATQENRADMLGSLTLMSSVSASNPELLQTVRAYNHRVRKIIESELMAGQSGGSVDSGVDARAMATAIVGAIRGIVAQAAIDETVDVAAAFDTQADGIRRVLQNS